MMKLFCNASFHLMDDKKQIAKAVLAENGRIIEIFMGNLPAIGSAELIDLKQMHVYPGFIDTHTHSFEGGLYSQSVDLSKAVNIAEVLALLDDYYHNCDKAETTVIDAFRFDENNIVEKRFPTRAELDSISTRLPIVLRRVDGHSSTINSCAWKRFCEANGYGNKNTDAVQSFSVSGLDKTQIQTTNTHFQDEILREELNDQVVHWFLDNLPDQTILKAYQQAGKIALANGITTVHTMVGDSQQSITHYKLIRDNLASFEAEYILYPQSFDIKAALDAGATRVGGCILADGALGSHTAALRKPYTDKPDSSGTLYHDNEYWEKFISEAHNHNLQVAVHCIGDRAIKQINDIYLRLYRQGNHDLRHELIHCELTPDDLLKEIVASHAVPVMQPSFDLYWGGDNRFYHNVLGNRYQEMNRFETFINNGVLITGGSDWYITELDALQGIRAAVHHHNPKEKINVKSAIDMYTENAAWLSHDENRLGKIEIGFDADFACLDLDIETQEGLALASVKETYKKGRQVY